MGRGPEQTFFQRKHTDGQQAHEKMFNITNYQGNAIQNHNKIPPHTCQNGHYLPQDILRAGFIYSPEIGRAHV